MTRALADLLDTDPITSHRGIVYFAEGGDGIKIGYTTDLGKRLADLRTAAASNITVAEYARAGKDVERELHRLLASEHIAREWFRDTDKTVDLMYLISDFLDKFDDDIDGMDGRDCHILTVEELRDIVARPYWWSEE